MLPLWRRPGLLLGGIALANLSAVALALFTPPGWGLQPCPWCVLQRLIALALALIALLALGAHQLRLTALRALLAGLAGALALGGIAAALWQHFVAAESASCALTLADRIMGATGLDGRFPEVFAAYASCADAKASLAGLPYEFWSLGLFVIGAIAAGLAMRPPRR